jgi:hypothetical protein
MAYFTTREVEAFLGHRDPAVDMEEYLRVLNVAHDFRRWRRSRPSKNCWNTPSPKTTSHGLPPRPLRPLWTCATRLSDRRSTRRFAATPSSASPFRA